MHSITTVKPGLHTEQYRQAITGNLTAARSQQIKEMVTELIAAGNNHLLLDMTSTEAVDIAGINVLVQIYGDIRAAGGSMELRLYRDSPLAHILHLTKFDKWFHLTFV